MSDAVNHPEHYNQGKFEVIEVITDQGYGEGFCKGNAIKYICRAGKKIKEREIQDLEKAVFYLQWWIEVLTAKKEKRQPIRPNDMNERIRTKKGESDENKM